MHARQLLLSLVLLVAALAQGCGDVSRLVVTLRFPDADTSSATQQLMFIVREPAEGDPCEALWGEHPTGLKEFTRLVDYPNRNDVVAAPLDVGRYTVFVYSYGTRLDRLCQEDADCETSTVGGKCRAVGADKRACVSGEAGLVPLAAACSGGLVAVDGATDLTMTLEVPPAG